MTARLHAAEAPWQPPESIRAAAAGAVARAGGGDVEAVSVDARLKLPACAGPLDAEIHRPLQRGQGTVAVRCAGPEPWRLFVPVRATDEVAVVIAQRSLQPGEVVTADDIAIRRQRSAGLPHEYLTDPGQAVGLVVRRGLAPGAILLPSNLDQPIGVERGALVTLIAGRDDVLVKVEGVALQAARVRQRVRVRSPSGRIVEGTVEAPGQVRVGL